jgi:hypothetical protein
MNFFVKNRLEIRFHRILQVIPGHTLMSKHLGAHYNSGEDNLECMY